MYTEAGWRARIAGRVEMTLTLDPAGHVTDALVTHPLPMGLDRNALETARRWTFAMAREPERRTNVTVEFVIDPPDEWEDGADWTADGTLRVWRVWPQSRLARGLAEGEVLPMDSAQALAASAAAIHHRAEHHQDWAQVVTLAGAKPTRQFMDAFADLPRLRVLRTHFLAPAYAEDSDVTRVRLSPRGQTIVEILTKGRPGSDLYALQLRDGHWVVVEFVEAQRPIY